MSLVPVCPQTSSSRPARDKGPATSVDLLEAGAKLNKICRSLPLKVESYKKGDAFLPLGTLDMSSLSSAACSCCPIGGIRGHGRTSGRRKAAWSSRPRSAVLARQIHFEIFFFNSQRVTGDKKCSYQGHPQKVIQLISNGSLGSYSPPWGGGGGAREKAAEGT